MAAEQVAEHLEEVAEATRRIDPKLVKYFLGGIGVGAAVGFFVGYRFNREKIKAEAFKEAEVEIDHMREYYQQKMVAIDNADAKQELIDLVVEENYVVESPVHFPSERLKPNVPIIDPQKRIFRSTSTEKDKWDGWNFPRELSSRTSDHPHIIHQDEFAQNESEYNQVTYVYYSVDDVLLDENNEIITNRGVFVVSNFQKRFGHGTDDYNILYIRNPVLELEIEICRSPGSYEEEVLGLEHEPEDVDSTE